MDADLYSSTKCIYNILKDYIDTDCIIIFDELLNYRGFDGETGEFYEFITENNVDYEWIGINGTRTGMCYDTKAVLTINGTPTTIASANHENVALIIHSIN
jgi:hypothetical protein